MTASLLVDPPYFHFQGAAGLLFEIVTPEYPPGRRMIARDPLRQPGRQPLDLREGLGMAYDVIREVEGLSNRVIIYLFIICI